ncbi:MULTISPECIES: hypothetical protein [unclassified Streptomyces]|uniref:hypothetical protein n=1 Tax=unclassified Streptomyces TaxID=2593676 RepID=UPI0035E32347
MPVLTTVRTRERVMALFEPPQVTERADQASGLPQHHARSGGGFRLRPVPRVAAA